MDQGQYTSRRFHLSDGEKAGRPVAQSSKIERLWFQYEDLELVS